MSNKIQLLPTSSSHLTPGWAYVPDTSYGGTTGGRVGGRKRAVRELGGAGGRADVSSSRQNTAILRHLAELDRENHKDTHIPIPTKQKGASAKEKTRGKTTSNVRRILMSQKTFKNYLDDEEAALAQAQSQGSTAATTATSSVTAAASAAARSAALKSSSKSNTPRTLSHPATPKSTTNPAGTTDQPSESQSATPSVISTSQQPPQQQLIASNYDNDPLLRSYIPPAPSEKLMQLLLAEPPLSYNASRATLTGPGPGRGPAAAGITKPPRHFCSICGYWGRVKCVKCRARACGLECYRIHEETRCDRFYA
ncbi:hypothetical protein AJ79_06541 [Helicocarpus griseus UAMH5409]|uniref:HIT-type domain-containing protein n=1 Tax=Helicocarpus griseus UAMH5409 TaxID=1447875 RepID=A0A2B7XCE7_9EURO|nr:hypothetical protein AJ79_06541 [Helicocarpus griseus UAMH5409]